MDHFIATILSILIVALCITVHYEVMNLMAKLAHRPERHRWILMTMMYGLLLAHVTEIWIFGCGYVIAQEYLQLGTAMGATDGLFDYISYSAMVYTTVGVDPPAPEGPIRILISTEALAGFSLITWSASFTFLQMQRLWRAENT